MRREQDRGMRPDRIGSYLPPRDRFAADACSGSGKKRRRGHIWVQNYFLTATFASRRPKYDGSEVVVCTQQLSDGISLNSRRPSMSPLRVHASSPVSTRTGVMRNLRSIRRVVSEELVRTRKERSRV